MVDRPPADGTVRHLRGRPRRGRRPVLRHSVLLQVALLIVGAVGTIAYLCRELLARYVVPIYDYTVADVRRPNKTTLEVGLTPIHQQLTFAPGQFVFLALGGAGGWQRHPFSVSSPPSDRDLELTIKAAGDYTRDLYDQLRPGIPTNWPARSAASIIVTEATTRYGSPPGSG